MSDFFYNFPTIEYNGIKAKNLLSRIQIARDVIQKIATFYPYQIREGERADQIALDYYGDANYIWLVYLSNDMIDPQYQWPMSDFQLSGRMIDLYGSIAASQATTVYYYHPDYTYTITPTTYSYMSVDEKTGWVAQDAYTEAIIQNEAKKAIKLVSRKLVNNIDSELQTIFKERVV